MYEIRDNIVVKIDTVESISQVSSLQILEDMKAIKETISSLEQILLNLQIDLEQVQKLESQLSSVSKLKIK